VRCAVSGGTQYVCGVQCPVVHSMCAVCSVRWYAVCVRCAVSGGTQYVRGVQCLAAVPV